MLNRLESSKNVVLIGSTSEIGLAIINQLSLEKGTNLHLIGKEKPNLNQFASSLLTIHFVPCNLESNDEIFEAIEYLKGIGRIDLAIVAAGYLPPENHDSSLESIMKTFAVNSFGCISFISAAATGMRRDKAGQIIFISSVATFRPRVKNFTYGSSKAGAEFFARGLALKYLGDGVKLTIVKPGFVFTKMTSGFKPAPFATDPEAVARIAVKGLADGKKVVFAPKKLKYVVAFLGLLPDKIFRIL